ncbi:MAG TPA: PLP-dependent aminotransferase family protein [Pyrinomonadaceae bacterium]|nr:PLP-dependent aminotransferase family protein [Pyrinomonadaceae bacterium]
MRELYKLIEAGNVISFAAGLPAPECFSPKELAQAFGDVIAEDGAAALQYSNTEGYLPLRQFIAERMTAKGVRAEAADVLISSGSQQGLDLIAKVLLNPGDKVLVERPTYLAALQTFSVFEAEIISAATDEEGLDVDDVERKLRQHPDIKMIYVVPNFQNPTGRTLSLERRLRLVRLAQRYGVRIVEDDAYGELRYRGQALLPLKALDESGLVIYIGTFSKTVSPGLRLGWIVADRETSLMLSLAKQATDLHTNGVAQRAAHLYLTRNPFEQHVARICRIYDERCRVMLNALERSFPASARWTQPEGGMFVWVELATQVRAAELLRESMRQGVAFIPGDSFFAGRKERNFMRLNFSNQPPRKIVEGVERLARVVAGHEAARKLIPVSLVRSAA